MRGAMSMFGEINKKIRDNGAYCVFVGFLLIFCYNAMIAIKQHYLFIMGDELGVAANAAFFVGEIWSKYISTVGYYGFGQSILYIPIYFFTKDPVVRSFFASIINSCVISSIFPIAFVIFNRHLKFPCILSLLYALFAALFPSYTVYSKWMWNETMMGCLPWLILLVILELNNNISFQYWGSALLAFLCVYSYSVHGRGFALAIVALLIIIGIWCVTNKLIIKVIPFIIILIIGYLVYYIIYHTLLTKLWLIGINGIVGNTFSSSVQRFVSIFTIAGCKELLLGIVSGIYTATCASFGLLHVLFCYCYLSVRYYLRNKLGTYTATNDILHTKHQIPARLEMQNWLISIAYIFLFFILAFSISVIFLKGLQDDYLIYTRYYANAIGMVSTFALVIMFRGMINRRGYFTIIVLIILALSSVLLFWQQCGFSRPFIYVNLYPFMRGDASEKLFYLTFIIATVSFIVLTLFYKQKKKMSYILLIFLSVYSYYYCVCHIVLVHYKIADHEVGTLQQTIRKYTGLYRLSPDVYAFVNGSGDAGRLQYALPEFRVKEYLNHEISKIDIDEIPLNSLIIINSTTRLEWYLDKCYKLQNNLLEEKSPYIVWVYGDTLKQYMKQNFNVKFHINNNMMNLNTFSTECGKIDNEGKIISSGQSGYLFYGAYADYPSGTYKIILKCAIKKLTGANPGYFDIVEQYGEKVILPAVELTNYVTKDEIILSRTVTVPQIAKNMELRLYVTKGTILEVQSISVEKMGYNSSH